MQTIEYRGYTIVADPRLITVLVIRDGRLVCSASSVATCRLMIDALAPREAA